MHGGGRKPVGKLQFLVLPFCPFASLDWLGGYLRKSQMFFKKSDRKLVCLLDIALACGGRRKPVFDNVTQNNVVSVLFLFILVDSREMSKRRTLFLQSLTN